MNIEQLDSYADLVEAANTGRGEWLSPEMVSAEAQIVTWILDDVVNSGVFMDKVTGQVIKIEQAIL